jgi:hypothetical protein
LNCRCENDLQASSVYFDQPLVPICSLASARWQVRAVVRLLAIARSRTPAGNCEYVGLVGKRAYSAACARLFVRGCLYAVACTRLRGRGCVYAGKRFVPTNVTVCADLATCTSECLSQGLRRVVCAAQFEPEMCAVFFVRNAWSYQFAAVSFAAPVQDVCRRNGAAGAGCV